MDRCEIFVRTVDCGSFTRAAETLGYTQSAVSQSIRALERELACVLLRRSRSGIELTPEGEALLPYIRGAAGAQQLLGEKARELEGLSRGTVRIGTYSSVSRCLLPPLIRDFKEQHPGVVFELTQGHCEEVERWVRERRADLGFSDLAGGSELTQLPLRRDEMLAVLPEGHPLAALPAVPLQRLAAEPFILLDGGNTACYEQPLRERGLALNVQYHVRDEYTIMSMAESGLGVSVLPRLVLERVPYRLAVRPLSPAVFRTIGLLYESDRTLPNAARAFLRFVQVRLPG
jgi:DNA-binding transcriptional LysR family regulator